MDIFKDELEVTKFKKDAEFARNHINQWVEDRTNSMIKNLLPPGSVDTFTDLVLVNAAYFKGMWLKKFNPSETRQEIFYVSPTKQIMVDMMHLEGTFNYGMIKTSQITSKIPFSQLTIIPFPSLMFTEVSESLGAHILEMPYQGEDVSMYILLPPFSKTNRALENTLRKLTLQEFTNIIEGKNAFSHTVQVSLPKFSLEQTIELVPVSLFFSIVNFYIFSISMYCLLVALYIAKLKLCREWMNVQIRVLQDCFEKIHVFCIFLNAALLVKSIILYKHVQTCTSS